MTCACRLSWAGVVLIPSLSGLGFEFVDCSSVGPGLSVLIPSLSGLGFEFEQARQTGRDTRS